MISDKLEIDLYTLKPVPRRYRHRDTFYFMKTEITYIIGWGVKTQKILPLLFLYWENLCVPYTLIKCF